MKVLIENGADVNITDIDGYTALMSAINWSKLKKKKYSFPHLRFGIRIDLQTFECLIVLEIV